MSTFLNLKEDKPKKKEGEEEEEDYTILKQEDILFQCKNKFLHGYFHKYQIYL